MHMTWHSRTPDKILWIVGYQSTLWWENTSWWLWRCTKIYFWHRQQPNDSDQNTRYKSTHACVRINPHEEMIADLSWYPFCCTFSLIQISDDKSSVCFYNNVFGYDTDLGQFIYISICTYMWCILHCFVWLVFQLQNWIQTVHNKLLLVEQRIFWTRWQKNNNLNMFVVARRNACKAKISNVYVNKRIACSASAFAILYSICNVLATACCFAKLVTIIFDCGKVQWEWKLINK